MNETYTAEDVIDYIEDIEDIVLKQKNDHEDTPESLDLLEVGSRLRKIYWALEAKRREEHLEEMRKQRYERGFSDEDVWGMKDWFIEIVGKMLRQLRETHMGSPATLGENYVNEEGMLVNDACHTEWEEILDRMIFLLNEMDEEKCTEKNAYEESVDKAREEFEKNHVLFGNAEIREFAGKKMTTKRLYMYYDDPDHPKWRDLHDKWLKEEHRLAKYRDDCKDEFFGLFSKHFWDLWD